MRCLSGCRAMNVCTPTVQRPMSGHARRPYFRWAASTVFYSWESIVSTLPVSSWSSARSSNWGRAVKLPYYMLVPAAVPNRPIVKQPRKHTFDYQCTCGGAFYDHRTRLIVTVEDFSGLLLNRPLLQIYFFDVYFLLLVRCSSWARQQEATTFIAVLQTFVIDLRATDSRCCIVLSR